MRLQLMRPLRRVREAEENLLLRAAHAAEQDHARTSQAEIAALVTASPLAIISYDRDGIVTSWSRSAEKILGWTAAEAIGRPSPLVPAERWPEFQEILQRALEGEQSLGLNLVRRRKDGSDVHIRVSTAPVVVDAAIAGMVSVIEDVTAASRTQEQLSRFFELTPDPLCLIAPDGRIIRVNPAFESTLGYVQDAIADGSLLDLLHPDEGAIGTEEAGARAINGVERRWRCPDGSERWLRWSVSPFPDDTLFLAVAHDLTERRSSEAELLQLRDDALEATQAKSEFLSRMSHELRTPLNAILGFAQLLALEELPASAVESVGQVTKAGRHLLALINEVLDIAQIEAGRLALSSEPIELRTLVDDAITLMAPLAAERAIDLRAPRVSDHGAYVQADRQRLTQVMLNLLANALKYSPAGTEVTVTHASCGAGRVRIEVRDQGPGIAPSDRLRLFMPFERLPDATAAGIEGTGLGLPLSKGLVELMGGTLGLKDGPGGGSIFWVELDSAAPQVALENGRSVAVTLHHPLPETAATVLYIEDNLANLRLIEHIFRARPGLKLLSAMQGRLGLSLAREHRPDLILLDLHLPDLHGSDVLRELRLDRRTAAIPVVIVTADATPGRTARLIEEGAAASLTKPIEIAVLLETVDRLLQSSRNPDPTL